MSGLTVSLRWEVKSHRLRFLQNALEHIGIRRANRLLEAATQPPTLVSRNSLSTRAAPDSRLLLRWATNQWRSSGKCPTLNEARGYQLSPFKGIYTSAIFSGDGLPPPRSPAWSMSSPVVWSSKWHSPSAVAEVAAVVSVRDRTAPRHWAGKSRRFRFQPAASGHIGTREANDPPQRDLLW